MLSARQAPNLIKCKIIVHSLLLFFSLGCFSLFLYPSRSQRRVASAPALALVSQLKHAAKHTESNLKNYVDLPQRRWHTEAQENNNNSNNE